MAKKKLTTKQTTALEKARKKAKEGILFEDTVDKKVIGLTLKEAEKFWDNIRVIQEDGVPLIATSDYQIMRMNVIVENEKIVKVFNFG